MFHPLIHPQSRGAAPIALRGDGKRTNRRVSSGRLSSAWRSHHGEHSDDYYNSLLKSPLKSVLVAAGLSPLARKRLVFFVLPGCGPSPRSDLGFQKQSCALQLDADATRY